MSLIHRNHHVGHWQAHDIDDATCNATHVRHDDPERVEAAPLDHARRCQPPCCGRRDAYDDPLACLIIEPKQLRVQRGSPDVVVDVEVKAARERGVQGRDIEAAAKQSRPDAARRQVARQVLRG